MHDEDATARLRNGSHKIAHELVALLVINTNAVLDRDRHINRIDHGFHAIGYQLGRRHQAGAKSPALHAIAGATTVQIDFVITPILAQLGAQSQVSRIAATQLQSNRMLFAVKAQMTRHVPVR